MERRRNRPERACRTRCRAAAAAILFAALGLGPLPAACAQQARPALPWEQWTPETFADPERFLREFLGTRPEEREALEQVEISFADEQRMGRQAAEAYLENLRRQGLAIDHRGRDVQYLRELLREIVPQMRSASRYRRLQVSVVDSEAVDARCFPGGFIIVFRGLLEFADSEAALVGILGHELAHLDRGHLLADMRRLKLAQQGFSNPAGRFDPQRMMSFGRMMMHAFARPFRSEDESEADRDGAMWAFERGYDPQAMAALFFRLSQEDPREAVATPALFRSHPYHRDRYRDITRLATDLQQASPGKPLYVGRENLRRRIPRDQQRFPE